MKSLLDVLNAHNPKLMGNGQIRMECPFREKHPEGSGQYSFFISPEIGAYHCFSCGAKGSAIKLLTKYFDVSYFDAVELVKLTEYKKEKKPFDLEIKWNIVPPKSFLARGYSEETLRHFKLGVTDEGITIIPFYWGKELKGYQTRRDTKDGKIVKNSVGFVKGEYLYNYNSAYTSPIIVEGYSDVMRMYQFGYNSIAVLGTYVSVWQAEKISKFKKVYLAFDNDLPGRRATEICYHRIKNNTEVLFVPYETKDPGECPRRSWIKAFERATDYMEYTVEMALNWEGYLDMKEEVLQKLEEER